MQFLKGDEGAQLTHWGVEGEHYTRDKDGLITYAASYQNEKTDAYDSGVAAAIEAAGFDARIRPEALTLEDFAKIQQALAAQ